MKTTATNSSENTDPVTPPRNNNWPGLRPSTPFSPEYAEYRESLRAGKDGPMRTAADGLLVDQAYDGDEEDDSQDSKSIKTETTTTVLILETSKDEGMVEEEKETTLIDILAYENHKEWDAMEAAAASPSKVGGEKSTQTMSGTALEDNGTTDKSVSIVGTNDKALFSNKNGGATISANLNDVAGAPKKAASRGGSLPPMAVAKYDQYQKQLLGQTKSSSNKPPKSIMNKSYRGESVHPCMKINKHSVKIGGSVAKKSIVATIIAAVKSVVKAAWSRHGLFFLPMAFFLLSSQFFLSQEFAICGISLVYYGIFVVMVMFA